MDERAANGLVQQAHGGLKQGSPGNEDWPNEPGQAQLDGGEAANETVISEPTRRTEEPADEGSGITETAATSQSSAQVVEQSQLGECRRFVMRSARGVAGAFFLPAHFSALTTTNEIHPTAQCATTKNLTPLLDVECERLLRNAKRQVSWSHETKKAAALCVRLY